jgi:hypothetical protein
MTSCHWCGGNTYRGYICKSCGKDVLGRDKGEKMTQDNSNIVNEPKHYARWVIEPITYIMRNGFEFWRGNIVKYASRAGFKLYEGKTQEESEIIDLEKVKRYCDMRINQINKKDKL